MRPSASDPPAPRRGRARAGEAETDSHIAAVSLRLSETEEPLEPEATPGPEPEIQEPETERLVPQPYVSRIRSDGDKDIDTTGVLDSFRSDSSEIVGPVACGALPDGGFCDCRREKRDSNQDLG